MKTRTVRAIILPYLEGIPLDPAVTTEDRISRAIELMVQNDLKCLAVVRHRKPIGMIRLADAFQELGLKVPQT
jgi:CBS domain-containing protein